MKQIPFLLVMLLTLVACGNRNPNIKRQELLSQLEELNEQQSVKTLYEIPEGYVVPAGIKYQPEYSRAEALIRLDIIKGLQNPVDYPLSKLKKDIEYRRVSTDRFSSIMDLIPIEEGYISKTMDALVLLNSSLQQERVLLKQDTELIELEKGFYVYSGKETIRNLFYTPSTRSLKCLVSYENPEKEREYKYYVGDLLLDDLLQDPDPAGMEKIFNRIHIGEAGEIWPAGEGFVLFKKWVDGLYTFTEKGDTLCYFLPGNPEPLHLKGTIRGGEGSNIYLFDEQLTFRMAFTDTVFRVADGHTFEPVYKIDLGSYQVSRKEGMSVSVSLEDKYLVHALFETPEKLFIRVSRNYDCPNTRNNKSIFFYQFVYDKKAGTLTCFNDPSNMHVPGKLKNDLDNGPDFWPDFLLDGYPTCGHRVRDLTDPQQVEWLRNKTGGEEFDEDDFILMIVK